MGVETNSIQFYPQASGPEAEVHPGLYQRRNGEVNLSSIHGSGFGYRLDEIKRQCQLSDSILRCMILKIDARIADALVSHAKGSKAAERPKPYGRRDVGPPPGVARKAADSKAADSKAADAKAAEAKAADAKAADAEAADAEAAKAKAAEAAAS